MGNVGDHRVCVWSFFFLLISGCTNSRITFNVDGLSRKVNELFDEVVVGNNELVVFDADGTIWRDDVGEDFLLWQIEHDVLAPENKKLVQATWKQYKAGELDERVIWTMAATCQGGLREQDIAAMASDFFRKQYRKRIFRQVQEAIQRLQEEGVEVWIVSASQKWIVEAGAREVGVPLSRVIAVTAVVRDGVIRDEAVLPIPLRAGKAEAIRRDIGRVPTVVVGNSSGDIEMLRLATKNAVVINPDDRLAELALKEGWIVQRIK